MKTTDYRPIDCDSHSVLELFAMHRARVGVRVCLESGAEQRLNGRVFDVLTKGGAEYLLLRDEEGEDHAIRLDRLLAIDPADGTPAWRQKTAPCDWPS